jgi:hypothetical protein
MEASVQNVIYVVSLAHCIFGLFIMVITKPIPTAYRGSFTFNERISFFLFSQFLRLQDGHIGFIKFFIHSLQSHPQQVLHCPTASL